MLIFAPCGSGKSYFVERASKELRVKDGDVILANAGVKNRNYYWYADKKVEQQRIRECIEQQLHKGFNVLYSGNPLVWIPDLIYLPSAETRWQNLMRRNGFRPSREQFEREELAYQQALREIMTVTSIDELTDQLN